MPDEELAAIHSDVEAVRERMHRPDAVPVTIQETWLSMRVLELLAEIERQREQIDGLTDALGATQDALVEEGRRSAAMREIVQAVAGLEARQTEVWNEVGLFHDSVNVLYIREQARALLGKK